MIAAAGALGMGIAIGLALPETDQENEWLGEARDSVIDRAQDAAQEAVSSVQQAAGEMVGDVARQIVGGKK
jgi:hypothetical protein